MAKNKVSEYSSIAANNVDIGGINIAEGCAPSGINNAIRELMAQLKDMQSGTDSDNFTVGGNLVVSGTATLSTALPASSGGTGNASYTIGDILYASGSAVISKLAGVTTGNVLLSGGVETAPAYGKVGLTTHVTGVLPIANGGTNLSEIGTNGQVLTSDGTAASWQTPTIQPSIGVSQTWQSPSRALNTTYTNSTGKPIMVNASVRCSGASVLARAFVGAVEVARSYSPDCCGVPQNNYFTLSFIVPNGATYYCTGADLTIWAELR